MQSRTDTVRFSLCVLVLLALATLTSTQIEADSHSDSSSEHQHSHDRARGHHSYLYRHRHTPKRTAYDLKNEDKEWDISTADPRVYTGATARPLPNEIPMDQLPTDFSWCHTPEGRSFCGPSWNQHIPE